MSAAETRRNTVGSNWIIAGHKLWKTLNFNVLWNLKRVQDHLQGIFITPSLPLRMESKINLRLWNSEPLWISLYVVSDAMINHSFSSSDYCVTRCVRVRPWLGRCQPRASPRGNKKGTSSGEKITKEHHEHEDHGPQMRSVGAATCLAIWAWLLNENFGQTTPLWLTSFSWYTNDPTPQWE